MGGAAAHDDYSLMSMFLFMGKFNIKHIACIHGLNNTCIFIWNTTYDDTTTGVTLFGRRVETVCLEFDK